MSTASAIGHVFAVERDALGKRGCSVAATAVGLSMAIAGFVGAIADIGTVKWTATAGKPIMRETTGVTAMRVPFSQSLAKTGTFAVLHFGVAFSIAYLLTGNLAIASAIALIEPAANTVAYLLHERAWARFTTAAPNPLRAGPAATAQLAPAQPSA